jgi:hypothetical protein
VPLHGIFTKIGGGELGALALDRGQPLEVERDRLVGLAESGNEVPAESTCGAPRTQAIEYPAAFAKTVEEARFAQELQMTRYAGDRSPWLNI